MMEHDYAMVVEAEVEVEVEVEEEVAVKKEEVVVVDEEVLLPATTSKVPIRPITSRWEMVKMKDYLKLGRRRSREGFWTSCPVRLVMSGLQRSTLTTDQTAPRRCWGSTWPPSPSDSWRRKLSKRLV